MTSTSRPREGLVIALLILGCSGGSGSDDDDGASGSVEIQSANCSVTESNTAYRIGEVVATGTASGSVGSEFHFGISNGGETAVTFDCDGWTVVGNDNGEGANNTDCVRGEGAPESISWTVTQAVYWCVSDCDTEQVYNNADLALKYLYAEIGDVRVDDQVTCP